jgi:hypothetical protein
MVDWKVRELNREDAKDTKEEKRGGRVHNGCDDIYILSFCDCFAEAGNEKFVRYETRVGGFCLFSDRLKPVGYLVFAFGCGCSLSSLPRKAKLDKVTESKKSWPNSIDL